MTDYRREQETPRNPFSPSTVWEFLTRRRSEGQFDIMDFITYLYLIVGAIVMFGPVLWLVMSSFKDESLINAPNPTFLPYRQETITVRGYNRDLPSNVDVPEPSFEFGKIGMEGYTRQIGLIDVTFKELHFNGVAAPAELTDIRADNGVVHGLEGVLVPPALESQLRDLQNTNPDVALNIVPSEEPAESGNLLEIVSGHPRMTVMGQLLASSSLAELVTGEERYTVLSPTDDAFIDFADEYGDKVLAALLMLENKPVLDELVRYHLLPDKSCLTTNPPEILFAGIQSRPI